MKLIWLGSPVQSTWNPTWKRSDHDEPDAALAQEKLASGAYASGEPAVEAPPVVEPESEAAPPVNASEQAMQDEFNTTPIAASVGSSKASAPQEGVAKPAPSPMPARSRK